jgi:holo-[acyl-carrier protein] synthase
MTMTGIRHGIDHVELQPFSVQCANRHFAERCFTQAERDAAKDSPTSIQYFAGRFAGKEAVLKALGTGWRDGVSWHDVEILREPSGEPRVELHGAVRELAESLGVVQLSVSISHTETVAIASVIALTADTP